ncbi:MAG: peptide ABC transporter substrate-binding protein [Spirochaetales bacterium]|nr:peptide ABC transporter substrate-binding protein [Spirochaetales bacterium]
MKNNRHISFIIIILSFFVMSSCITVEKEDSVVTDVPDVTKESGDQESEAKEKNELVIALGPTSMGFDPLHAFTSVEAQFYTATYDGLVMYDQYSPNPTAALAQRWEISEDKLTYTFYLRENALYSNGDKVTAGDVKKSWFRFLDPAAQAEYSVYYDIIKGAKAYRLGQTDDPDTVGIEVINDNTLKVVLEKPAIHFLYLLCHMSFVVVHPRYSDSDSGDWAFDKNLISNGPYFLSLRTNDEMIFKKNNLYWNSHNVSIETIRVILTDDRKKLTEAFNNYQIQWSMYWEQDLIDNNSFLVAYPMFATHYYFFVCSTSPWNDPRVRRGLALLVPWDKIRSDFFYFGTEKLVPKLSKKYPDVKGITAAHVEEGLDLLNEAGFPGGEGLPSPLLKIPSDKTSKDIVQIIADSWKEHLNLEIKTEEIPPELYFDSLRNPDFTVGTTTWIGDFADPLTFLELWTSDSNLNEARYSNPEYDKLIHDSYLEEDMDKRYELLAKGEEMLLTQAVIIPLKNNPSINLINTKLIEGWYINLLDIHPFQYLKFKEAKVYPNIVMR